MGLLDSGPRKRDPLALKDVARKPRAIDSGRAGSAAPSIAYATIGEGLLQERIPRLCDLLNHVFLWRRLRRLDRGEGQQRSGRYGNRFGRQPSCASRQLELHPAWLLVNFSKGIALRQRI